jgi:prefoldin subunit 5
MQLIEKDVSHLNLNLNSLSKNYENLSKTINEVQTDIHQIKGSMGAVHQLLEQLLKQNN